ISRPTPQLGAAVKPVSGTRALIAPRSTPPGRVVDMNHPRPVVGNLTARVVAPTPDVVPGRPPMQVGKSQLRPAPSIAGQRGVQASPSQGGPRGSSSGTSVPPSIAYDPTTGVTVRTSSNVNDPPQPGDTYTVSLGRRMDANGQTSELYGIYSS